MHQDLFGRLELALVAWALVLVTAWTFVMLHSYACGTADASSAYPQAATWITVSTPCP